MTKPPYKIIYSTDIHTITNTISPYHRENEMFRPEMLDACIEETAGIGIDAHKIVPGYGWVPRWKSRQYPIEEHWDWYLKKYGEPRGNQRNIQYGFVKYMLDGGDYVERFVGQCRKHGQSPLACLRLNDEQGGAGVEGNGRFVEENPQFTLGWSGYTRGVEHYMNWIHPEVRRFKLNYAEELAGYDIDGLELDFMRRPTYFRLDQTSQLERERIMTGFVAETRAILDRTSRSGKRRRLGVRVPCHLAEYGLLGLDLEALVDAGVDMVNVSPSMFTQQQTDLPTIRRLLPDTAVYLEVSDIIDKPAGEGLSKDCAGIPRRPTDEQFYTTAHLAYARGADGICTFNFRFFSGKQDYPKTKGVRLYEPPFHIFPRLRDPEWLGRQSQHWFLCRGHGGYAPWLDGSRCAYMMRNAAFAPASPLPCRLKPGMKIPFCFDMAPPEGGARNRPTADSGLRFSGRSAVDGDYQQYPTGRNSRGISPLYQPLSRAARPSRRLAGMDCASGATQGRQKPL